MKLLQVMGLLLKEETTYADGTTTLSNTTDGLQLQYPSRYQGAPMEFDYANDGDLGPSVSALGQTARVGPTGFSIRGPLPFRFRGGGVAYSASVVPSFHRALKVSGFTATLDSTAGTEKWTYTPTPAGTGYASAASEMYTRGEKWPVIGLLGNVKLDAPDTKPAIWTLDAMGIASLPTDVSTPSITYPLQTVQPPQASSIALTLGGLSTNAEILSHSFDMQRELTPRVNQNGAGGHRGFVPGDRRPIIKLVLEATALVTGAPYTSGTAFDPYRLLDKGQVIAASLKHGTAQYNRMTINFPQCQVIEAKPSSKDAIATVELTLAAHNSTASSNDDVNIVAD